MCPVKLQDNSCRRIINPHIGQFHRYGQFAINNWDQQYMFGTACHVGLVFYTAPHGLFTEMTTGDQSLLLFNDKNGHNTWRQVHLFLEGINL